MITRLDFRKLYRRVLKHIVGLILFYSGMWWLFTFTRTQMYGGKITILAYHGVNPGPFSLNLFVSPTTFEAQMRFLTRHCEVVPLSRVEALVRSGRRLTHNVVVLTFDDGYRDNYEFALPILSKLCLPAAIYLTTNPIDENFPTFVYALILVVHHTGMKTLDLSRHGLRAYSLDSAFGKEVAIAEVDRHARRLASTELRALLDDILSRLGYSRTDALFRDRMLSWDLIRSMRRSGIVFGAHTVTHPVLSRLSAAEIQDEICESKRVIEEHLGEIVTSFAYPYGSKNDINSTAVECVKRCGFSSAVVLYEGDPQNSDLFALQRKMITEDTGAGTFGRFSRAVFACEVAGIFDVLFRSTRRHASADRCHALSRASNTRSIIEHRRAVDRRTSRRIRCELSTTISRDHYADRPGTQVRRRLREISGEILYRIPPWILRIGRVHVFELRKYNSLEEPLRPVFPSDCAARYVTRDEIPAVAVLARTSEVLCYDRFDRGEMCFAVFRRSRPVNITWIHLGSCYIRGVGYSHQGQENVAYIYGILTDPSERGKGLYRNALISLSHDLFRSQVERLVQFVEPDNIPVLHTLPTLGYVRTAAISHMTFLGVKYTKVRHFEDGTIETRIFVRPPDIFHI